jgi:signal transduction histidine kinase
MVRDAHRSLGRLATELRPSILDDMGLRAAVEAHLEEFARRSGVGVRAAGLETLDRFGGEAATAIFRIVQESLTNVSRHAGAGHVDVAVRPDGRSGVVVTVEDDGRGIGEDGPDVSTGLGILGMKERAALHGGGLSVRRRPEGGTLVSLVLPDPDLHLTSAHARASLSGRS